MSVFVPIAEGDAEASMEEHGVPDTAADKVYQSREPKPGAGLLLSQTKQFYSLELQLCYLVHGSARKHF